MALLASDVGSGTAAEIMKPLVDDFDRVWPGIPRTREIMTMVEEIGG